MFCLLYFSRSCAPFIVLTPIFISLPFLCSHWMKFSKTSCSFLNPLPDDNILVTSKLKAHADDKINVTEKTVLGRVEDIVVTSIFSFSPMFSKAFRFYRVVKSCNCMVKGLTFSRQKNTSLVQIESISR